MRTTTRVRLAAVLGFAAAALVGATLRADPPPARPPWMRGQTGFGGFTGERTGVVRDPALDAGEYAARIGAVGARYMAWGRVDDELRWAPYLCRSPNPSVPRESRAEGGGHARKVYFLYARDRNAYLATRPVVGQVIVKESWTHRPVALRDAQQVYGVPIAAEVGGQLVEPDQPMGLFVMMYVGRAAPGADEGWIYGTVSPSGEVTSAGRVASCMGCHVEAPHGRLFGLARVLHDPRHAR